MLFKGVRPRTHLLIDSLQASLLTVLAVTALLGELLERADGGQTHLWFMIHVVHVISGVSMCLTVGLHLLLHLPWIQAQLTRLVRSQP